MYYVTCSATQLYISIGVELNTSHSLPTLLFKNKLTQKLIWNTNFFGIPLRNVMIDFSKFMWFVFGMSSHEKNQQDPILLKIILFDEQVNTLCKNYSFPYTYLIEYYFTLASLTTTNDISIGTTSSDEEIIYKGTRKTLTKKKAHINIK